MGFLRTNIFSVFILFCILFSSEKLVAQKPILFQIPSSNAQIEAANTLGDTSLVEEYKRSDNQIKNAIYKDFRMYFEYGPVYFFQTKDAEDVQDGKLDKVSFEDNTGAPITLPQDLKEYYTANISFFPKVYRKTEQSGETILEETPENHFGLGIILRDENYQPLMGKLRFTECKIAKRGPWLNRKKRYYVFKGCEALNRKMAGKNVSE